jgi:hypothetical protein
VALTREQILARKVGQGVVTLHDGSTVLVRGCTRKEAQRIQDQEEGEPRDAMMISLGMVDPELSHAEVLDWFATAPNGDLLEITRAIMEMSGMGPGQGKEATKSVPG